MGSQEFELTFQSESVSFWGLFLVRIAAALGVEFPSLRRTTIKLTREMLSTVSVVAQKEADLGLVTPPACVTMAYRGVGPYSKKMDNLRAIGSFPHDDRMMWAVPADSGINSIEEMKNGSLRLVIPSKEFPVRFAVEEILEAYGMSLKALQGHGWQIIEENHCLKIPLPVIAGEADALVHEGRKTPPWFELTQSRLMKFLPISADVLQKMEDEYGYRKGILSKGMLRGIEEDVPCIDFSDWLMFTHSDMPDEIAYCITKTFIEKREEYFEIYFRGLPDDKSDLVCPIDPRQVWRNIGEIPLHPAAERYYKEHKYM